LLAFLFIELLCGVADNVEKVYNGSCGIKALVTSLANKNYRLGGIGVGEVDNIKTLCSDGDT
jgi:hypothetical protein